MSATSAVLVLARLALLAAADSRHRLPDSRLDFTGCVSRLIFRRVDVADFQSPCVPRNLVAPNPLDAHRCYRLGRAGNVARPFARRLSLEFPRRLAIPARPAHPDRLGDGRLRCVISRRVVFTHAVLHGAIDFARLCQTTQSLLSKVCGECNMCSTCSAKVNTV